MKLMVVDDEVVSRQKMVKILSGLGDCDSFGAGSDALEAFKAAHRAGQPYDLAALDVNMPLLSGMEVLQQIRDFERQTASDQRLKVLMVTAHADQSTVTNCLLASCDGYIVKPFNGPTVRAKIDKMMGKRPVVSASLLAAKTGDKKGSPAPKASLLEMIMDRFSRDQFDLPALPHIGTQVRQAVAEATPIAAIAELIKTDMAISTELIRVANSPFFRGSRDTRTVEQAICRMGLQATCQYVEAIAGRAVYASVPKALRHLIEPLWRHALACAHVCRFTADALNDRLGEDPFTLGLLHDIGKLVLIRIYSDLLRQGHVGGTVGPAELDREMEQCHGRFGEALLRRWGFGPAFVQAARYHHNLAAVSTASKELVIVAFADELVTHLETAAAGTPWHAEDSDPARRLQLFGLVVDALYAQAADTMAHLGQVLSL